MSLLSYVYCGQLFPGLETFGPLTANMSNPAFSRSTLYSALSVVGLGWYVVLWSIGLLGCRIG